MHLTVLGETGWRNVEAGAHPEFASASRGAAITARSLMIWGEHCTDCANPTCYSSCSLYTPREDLKCRRFTAGLEPLRISDGPLAGRHMLAASFRRWGKLEAEGSSLAILEPLARAIEAADETISRLLDWKVLPYFLRRFSIKCFNWLKQRLLRLPSTGVAVDGFLIEAINLRHRAADLRLSIFNMNDPQRMFETIVTLSPGRNSMLIDRAEIAARIELGRHMRVALEPMLDDQPVQLALERGDFVVVERRASDGSIASGGQAAATGSITSSTPASTAGYKCVVWDLDNTLWNGVLVEDGTAGISIRPEVISTITELDRRGVLNSIVSKNDRALVEPVLRRAGLWDFFLFPQINWEPKSQNIRAIANAISIGLDTFLFVDDQPFERAEVAASLPMVDVLDVATIETLLDHSRMPTIVSKESAGRRRMYQQEQARAAILSDAGGDYSEFLRSCGLVLVIDPLSDSNFGRVFELTERTNQLNYTGRRLTRPALERLRDRQDERTAHVLSARDRFGEYGIIGLAVVDEAAALVTDFFMSCRVQRKRVDHAYFEWLRARVAARGAPTLAILYQPSGRNGPSHAVLAEDMALVAEAQEGGGGLRFIVPLEKPIRDADIVTTHVSPDLNAPAFAWE